MMIKMTNINNKTPTIIANAIPMIGPTLELSSSSDGLADGLVVVVITMVSLVVVVIGADGVIRDDVITNDVISAQTRIHILIKSINILLYLGRNLY